MLDIARSQGWQSSQFEALYEEAVKKFPYYLVFYFTKGSFYSAKWYGSQKEFHAFVEESVKATEVEMGQTMYARLNWSAWTDSMFSDGQTDWARMKQGFERMLQDFPGAWNRNNFAKFACMAGDLKTLHEQLHLIGDQAILPAWDSMPFFETCRIASENFSGSDVKGKQ